MPTAFALAACCAAGLWMAPAVVRAGAEGERPAAVRWEVPASVRAEHEELHARLQAATKAGGRTGTAASEVARLLHPHFEKEERYALPPLALLPALVEGTPAQNLERMIALTDQLRSELPRMLEEHRAIVAALQDLTRAATAENKPEQVRFAEALAQHARMEEEILYPAAILVGEHLKLRRAGGQP